MLAPYPEQTIYYPESDGKPMAETDVHRDLLFKMVDLLRQAFPTAYVSGNICLYYEQGNPKKMISPDSLLCLSQSPGEKRVYLAWEKNAQIDLVMEYSSFSTRKEDHFKKKKIYEELLKVPYYVIFDPHAVYLSVFELGPRGYQPLETNEQGRCLMSRLPLAIAIENSNSLRLFNAQGEPILSSAEKSLKQVHEAMQEKEQAVQEKKQAMQEKEQAMQEKKQAMQEQNRLRELLRKSGINPDLV
ncbi:MAG: Uma2 family endonuclease [SAR324 cluster bacterium]|nr:Uma2 family endonuclease [SAR324 cluster bacterium]